MRAITVFVSSVVLAAMTGCAANSPQPAKMPDPITYDRAAYNPPSEFDMSFAAPETPADARATRRTEPAEASYKARLVSLEKPTGE